MLELSSPRYLADICSLIALDMKCGEGTVPVPTSAKNGPGAHIIFKRGRYVAAECASLNATFVSIHIYTLSTAPQLLRAVPAAIL